MNQMEIEQLDELMALTPAERRTGVANHLSILAEFTTDVDHRWRATL